MKKTLLFILLCSVTNILRCQTDIWTSISTEKRYGRELSMTSDGHILQTSQSFEDNDVTKINSSGDIIWTKDICNCFENRVVYSAELSPFIYIHIYSSGRMYTTNTNGDNPLYVGNLFPEDQVDGLISSFNLVEKGGVVYFYGNEVGGEIFYIGEMTLSTLDVSIDSHVTNGRVYENINVNNANEIALIYRIGTSTNFGLEYYGNMNWSIEFPNTGIYRDLVMTDSKIIVGGMRLPGGGGKLMFVDYDGDIIYENDSFYDSNNGLIDFENVEIWNGHILAVGRYSISPSSDGIILCFDIDGEEVWRLEKEVINLKDDFFEVLVPNSNSSYFFLSGTTTSDQGFYDNSFLMKIGDAFTSSIDGIVEIKYEVYPNPFTDYLYIDSNHENGFEVSLYSSDGKCIFEKLKRDKLDLEHLPSGSYLLKFTNEGLIYSKKILKL